MPRENKTKYAILGCLTIKPMSPYEVKSFMQHNTNFFWAEREGQLYPTFKLLSEAGYVSYEEVPAQKSGTKKIYSITESGRELFDRWFASKTTDATERNPALLKLFFARTQSPKQVLKLLEEMQRNVLEEIDAYNMIEKKIERETEEGIDGRFYSMTLQLGLKQAISFEEWCRDCIEKVEAEIAAAA